ncbi:MAG: hypothetical protein ABWY11_04815 [Umezawaea sp.]
MAPQQHVAQLGQVGRVITLPCRVLIDGVAGDPHGAVEIGVDATVLETPQQRETKVHPHRHEFGSGSTGGHRQFARLDGAVEVGFVLVALVALPPRERDIGQRRRTRSCRPLTFVHGAVQVDLLAIAVVAQLVSRAEVRQASWQPRVVGDGGADRPLPCFHRAVQVSGSARSLVALLLGDAEVGHARGHGRLRRPGAPHGEMPALDRPVEVDRVAVALVPTPVGSTEAGHDARELRRGRLRGSLLTAHHGSVEILFTPARPVPLEVRVGQPAQVHQQPGVTGSQVDRAFPVPEGQVRVGRRVATWR